MKKEFLSGIRDTIPLVIGAAPFGFLFGLLARATGLDVVATIAMSIFVFAGASQFAAVKLLAAGAAYPLIVLTTFVINLRHALYAASLAEYLRDLPRRWRALLAFQLTDESYAVVITHYRDAARGDAAHKQWYFLGANLAMYVAWQIDTALGFLVGNWFGDPRALGLDFAATLMFIAILAPQIKSRVDGFAALVAGAVALAAFALPSKIGLLLAIGAGIGAGVMLEQASKRERTKIMRTRSHAENTD